jgi:hypothetical protein
MQHRHLNSRSWTKAAIDSALEYGELPDWRELFRAAAADRTLAEDVVAVARAHPMDGASALAIALIENFWPGLA